MLKRWGKIAAWNLGLLVAAAVAAELVFGSWFHAPGLWNLGIFRDVRWVIDVSEHYARKDPIIYSRDYFGLRGAFGGPGQANILALGGSTTDERKVDDAETWAETMASCLRGQGLDARVANAGVAGQTTRGHATNFDVWLNRIPGFRPRLAIAYFGVNENALEGRSENDDVTRYFETKHELSVWHHLRNWIGMNSAILRLHRIVKGNIKAYRAGLHPLAAPKAHQGKTTGEGLDEELALKRNASLSLTSAELAARRRTVEQKMEPEIEALKERLNTLKTAIEAFGARPVFVTQNAASYRLGEERIWGDVDKYIRIQALARATVDYCDKNDMPCIDLAAEVFFGDGDAYDGVHTTSQGSRKVGLAICRKFDPAWLRP